MTKIGVEFETTRVNYNLPSKLVERVKEYSREMGVPITYGVVLLLNKGLENSTMLEQLPKVTKFIEDYQDGKFSDIKDKSSESLWFARAIVERAINKR